MNHPPFCPNPYCPNHFQAAGSWFIKTGSYHSKTAPVRDLSRILNASCSTVTDRIRRLAHQCLPNNIHILAGKKSQFWFLSDYATFKSGAMAKGSTNATALEG